MNACVVCTLPDGQYCEFCPNPDNIDTGPEEAEDITYKFLTDRDPGDETSPILFNYRALYSIGNVYYVRRFQAEDANHADKLARAVLAEDETLEHVVRHFES